LLDFFAIAKTLKRKWREGLASGGRKGNIRAAKGQRRTIGAISAAKFVNFI
jgi:hypothetical protein